MATLFATGAARGAGQRVSAQAWAARAALLAAALVCGPGAGGCRARAPARDRGPPREAPPADRAVVSGRLTPPAGKTLLFVGQDLGSIAGYVRGVAPDPGGVTTYTDLSEKPGKRLLASLRTLVDYGAGELHAQRLLETYPHAALAIGLFLVDGSGTNLDHVADGTHDALIDELGGFLRAAKRPVYLRIGYEFDGAWNHYDPVKYKAAFRHIALRLRAGGGDDVAFVWQSATYRLGRYRGLPLDAWYPGDDVVDWMGSSYFKFAPGPHEELLALARRRRKPVMIAEAAPQGYDLEALTFSDDGERFVPRTAEQIWREWYAPFFAFVRANADVVRAVAYIDCDWQAQRLWASGAQGYWGDSRIEANALVRRRWLEEIGTPRWLHGGPGLFGALGARP